MLSASVARNREDKGLRPGLEPACPSDKPPSAVGGQTCWHSSSPSGCARVPGRCARAVPTQQLATGWAGLRVPLRQPQLYPKPPFLSQGHWLSLLGPPPRPSSRPHPASPNHCVRTPRSLLCGRTVSPPSRLPPSSRLPLATPAHRRDLKQASASSSVGQGHLDQSPTGHGPSVTKNHSVSPEHSCVHAPGPHQRGDGSCRSRLSGPWQPRAAPDRHLHRNFITKLYSRAV